MLRRRRRQPAADHTIFRRFPAASFGKDDREATANVPVRQVPQDLLERVLPVPPPEARMRHAAAVPLSILPVQFEEEVQSGLSRRPQAPQAAAMLHKQIEPRSDVLSPTKPKYSSRLSEPGP